MQEDDNMQPKVVLLAEDDTVNVEIVRHILLQMPGVEVVVAFDGRQALELAMAKRFDLMIFDRNMPHISGDRVIRQLKASRTINDGTPIIQFTADANQIVLNGGNKAMADATVPKPVQAAKLLSVVQRLLAR